MNQHRGDDTLAHRQLPPRPGTHRLRRITGAPRFKLGAGAVLAAGLVALAIGASMAAVGAGTAPATNTASDATPQWRLQQSLSYTTGATGGAGGTDSAGGLASYRLTLSGDTADTVAVADVAVVDTYPAGAAVVGSPAQLYPGDGTVNAAAHTITWHTGALDPASRQSWERTFTLRCDGAPFAPGGAAT
ncbi:MAG: hypothetical protein LBQ06_07665, partial [Frankiaceae bacterium]|nr:hypothetical protein [Frankiaceae bacterium]